jgi:Flp pilus assembly protein TadG
MTAEFSRCPHEVGRFGVSLYKLLNRDVRGQALIETALVLPLLLVFVFNTVNFGYFLLVAINLAAAPRTGALYSILGSQTTTTPALPAPSVVNSLTVGDLTGAIYNGVNTKVQVCTPAFPSLFDPSTGLPNCTQYNTSPTYAVAADPEPSNFVLNQVDVTYSFSPLIDKTFFNAAVLAAGFPCSVSGGNVYCTFHRRVYMRVMD